MNFLKLLRTAMLVPNFKKIGRGHLYTVAHLSQWKFVKNVLLTFYSLFLTVWYNKKRKQMVF